MAKQTVTAYNTGTTPLDVHVVLSGFRQRPSGAIVFGRPGAISDASWIRARPDVFALAPGQHQRVHLRIAVPSDAEPGDHQVGVVFLVPALTSDRNLTINRGVGSTLLIRAPGPVVHDVALTALDAPWLSTGGAVPVQLSMRNAGTVHHDFLAPDGRIVGRAAGGRLPFPSLSVLAGATRTVNTAWSDPPWLCHCTLTVSVPDGHGGLSTVHTTVWVVPIYQILGALLLSGGLLALVLWRRNSRQSALEAARRRGYQDALARTENALAGS